MMVGKTNSNPFNTVLIKNCLVQNFSSETFCICGYFSYGTKMAMNDI